jgi:hypothetical protein
MQEELTALDQYPKGVPPWGYAPVSEARKAGAARAAVWGGKLTALDVAALKNADIVRTAEELAAERSAFELEKAKRLEAAVKPRAAPADEKAQGGKGKGAAAAAARPAAGRGGGAAAAVRR